MTQCILKFENKMFKEKFNSYKHIDTRMETSHAGIFLLFIRQIPTQRNKHSFTLTAFALEVHNN